MGNTLWAEGEQLQKIATGATWSEGPLWVARDGVVRWSDIPGNRILEVDPLTRELREWRTDVEFTNGRAFHPIHGVIHCSHGRRAIEIAGDEAHESPRILVNEFEGKQLNSPNDLTVASDGSVWFTDPPYGIVQAHEGHLGEQEYGGCYVFRYTPRGELSAQITTLLRPNGIAFSPDGKTLYVTNTEQALGDGPGRDIWAFDVDENGNAIEESGRIFASPAAGLPDGIAIDTEGRIWSSGAEGVTVFDSEGTEVGFIAVPETVGNLCFGGECGNVLFIAATSSIYMLNTLTTAA